MVYDYATNFAVIEDGVVVNIIWGMVYTASGVYPDSVKIEDLPVSIGDTYDGGVFYHNGERVLTIAEQITALQESVVMEGPEG